MATATIESTRDLDADQCVELRDVGWKGYSTLLRLRGDRAAPRIIYLDGTVWLMSPAFRHDWVSRPQTEPETAWIKAFRRWVKSTLMPRATERGAKPADADPQQTDIGDRKES